MDDSIDEEEGKWSMKEGDEDEEIDSEIYGQESDDDEDPYADLAADSDQGGDDDVDMVDEDSEGAE